MRQIWFLRHGESAANLTGLFAGQREDSLLTEKGIAQAKTAAQELNDKGIVFDQLIASPLRRTHQTALEAQAILGITDDQMSVDDRVTEYDMGALTGTPIRKVTSAELVSAEGAENPELFRARVLAFCREAQAWPEGNYLVVSHAGVGRCIEATRLGMPASSFYDLEPYPNAHAVVLDLSWLT